ncbi:acyltransferase [Geomonas anaerohicana]|uniref:Acyltransferase n=1 Tax=Geomonas anaerohicana TaxID=2798583 RepID=A0ABS0YIU7_9BACT|nr:DapH/DapD/GlmU-related protein [Geomonas anaerohicana]MBJ6752193.1 hypothetical protein [Geomonas anaerohicana]
MGRILRYLTNRVPGMVSYDLMCFRPRFFLFLFNLVPDLLTLSPLRNVFLRLGGAKIDIFNAYIRSPLWCSDLRHIRFGNGIFINMGCRFEGTATTIIGDHCQIGPFCCFENVNHTEEGDVALPVIVGNGVWIGARAVLTPGAEVGSDSVVAAGAVVTKKIPANELWGGVPAKKIRATHGVQ